MTKFKAASVRCQHQSSKGCRVYDRRPLPCQVWSCRWLFDPDTSEIRRPDHARYVIDSQPDEIRQTTEDGTQTTLDVLQVWVDPATPDAWRDPRLADYMRLCARKYGMAAIIRWGSYKALIVFPPDLCGDRQWHEFDGNISPDIGLYAASQRFLRTGELPP